MEKERKITAPEGCEIEKVEIVDGVAVVTFREKERELPKTWEEFCEMTPIKEGECYIDVYSKIRKIDEDINRHPIGDEKVLRDKATAEAVLALCQLIQLRNCYNGAWVPDWTDEESKHSIYFYRDEIFCDDFKCYTPSVLNFRDRDLRDEFLHNFRPLIEKLMPLYGIKDKKGGEERTCNERTKAAPEKKLNE